jgi:phospholipid/cholesterol/gamma-HCH transport system permease protein
MPAAPRQDRRPDDAGVAVEGVRVRATGAWTVGHLERLERSLATVRWPDGERIVFDLSGAAAVDSAGAWLLRRTVAGLEGRGRVVAIEGLAESARRILALVTPEDGAAPAPQRARRPPRLVALGRSAARQPRQAYAFLSFVGELCVTTAGVLARPWRIRGRATVQALQAAGPNALPIVGLLTFLLGVVIAYQGGVALREYGATHYVADLVGVSMLRELAPLITAIIVAGRTGSAYTAHLGTMVISEEVDALRTMSVSPMELLVVPRLLALLVALPLLTVFADAVSVLGGMLMTNRVFGLGYGTFLGRLDDAQTYRAFVLGILKTPVFAAVIAAVGCYQGFRVHGSAESVGRRTTMSVVQSIVLVILVDAAFSVLFSTLGL